MEEQDKDFKFGDEVRDYLRLEYDILRLQLTEKAALSGAALIANLIVTIMVALGILFLSFCAAYYLGSLMGSMIQGFLLVGCIYVVISILLILLRKKYLVDPLRDKIIQELLKKKNGEDK